MLSNSQAGIENIIRGRAEEQVKGTMTLSHNKEETRYTLVNDKGVSYVWEVVRKYTESAKGSAQQPCWECEHAVPDSEGTRGCPWSRSFSPVPGWDAIKTQPEGSADEKDASYKIIRCPMFKRG